MLFGRISKLQVRNPRRASQPGVVRGGVLAQCQRIDHTAAAAAIPNAMESQQSDGVRPAELQYKPCDTPSTPTQSASKKAKTNPSDTPSQTHILTLNPPLTLFGCRGIVVET